MRFSLSGAGTIDVLPKAFKVNDQNSSLLINLTDVSDLTSKVRKFRLTQIVLSLPELETDVTENVYNEGFRATTIPFIEVNLGDAAQGQNPDVLCPGPFDHWEFHDLIALSMDGDDSVYYTTFSIFGHQMYTGGEAAEVLHVPRVCSPNGEWNNYPTFLGRITVDRSDPVNPSAKFDVIGAVSWFGFGDPDSGGDRPERNPMASNPVRCSLYAVEEKRFPLFADTHVLCRDDTTGRIYSVPLTAGDFGGDLKNSTMLAGGYWFRPNVNDAEADGASAPGTGCACEYSDNCDSCGFAQLIANTPYPHIRSSGGAQCSSLVQPLDYPPWEYYHCVTYQHPGFAGSWHHSATHCNPSVLFEENLWYILKLLKDDTSLAVNIDYSPYLPENVLDRCYAVFRVEDDACVRNRGLTGPVHRRCFTSKKDGSCYVGYPLWDPIWYPTTHSPYYSKNFVCRRDLLDYFLENPGDDQIWADMTKFFQMNYGMRNTDTNDIQRWEFANHWAVDSMNCYFEWIEALTGVKAVFGLGRDQPEFSGSQGMRVLVTKPPPPLAPASTGIDNTYSNQDEATPVPGKWSTQIGSDVVWPYAEASKEKPGRPGKFGFLKNEFLTPVNDMCLREVSEASGWWGHMRMEQRMVFNLRAGPIRSWQALAIPNQEELGGISRFGGSDVGDHYYRNFLVDYLSANDIFDWNDWWNPDGLDEDGKPVKDIRDPGLTVNNKAIHAERFYDPETLQPIVPNKSVAETYADVTKYSWPLEWLAEKGARHMNAQNVPMMGDHKDNELLQFEAEPFDSAHLQRNPQLNQFEYKTEIIGYVTAWIYDPLMPFGSYDLKPPILTNISTATQLYGWQKMIDRLPIRSGDNIMEGCIPEPIMSNEDSPGGMNEYKCVPLRAALCGPNNSKLDQCTNFSSANSTKINHAKTGLLDDGAQNKKTFWRISSTDELLDMNTTSVSGHAWEWNIPDIGVALDWGDSTDQGPSERLNYRFDKCNEDVMRTTFDYPKRGGEQTAEGFGFMGAYSLGPGAWAPRTWGTSSVCDMPYELAKVWMGGNPGNVHGVKAKDYQRERKSVHWDTNPILDEFPKGEMALAHMWLAQACYARQARAAGTKISGPGEEGDHFPLSGSVDEQWAVPGIGVEKLAYRNEAPQFVQ
eukprot:GHVH01005490.1.p1 GENE.GHVH01005490.1~~GHVH01005490.1.p1  ORF type:complete len:1145 (-),score=155.26 GHVH01005490.1:81-3515(-)